MHQDWVRMATSLGAGDYAEDIVQESYIRLLKYASTDALIKNGKVNKMYMWVTISNCLNTHRTKNKFYEPHVYHEISELRQEQKYIKDEINLLDKKSGNYNSKLKTLNSNLDNIELTIKEVKKQSSYKDTSSSSYEYDENHFTESYSQEDGDRDLAFGRLEGLIDNEVDSWHWYDKMLFKIYRESGKSIRKLSAETGISVRSIWKTLKDCKDRIEENVGEDYIDYKNEDYELIKEI